MAKSGAFIGFPEGMLWNKPVRLRVLENHPDWFAIHKYAGLLGQVHPWFKDHSDITTAIRVQVDAGKGELARLGIGEIFHIFSPELEVAGPMLFAKNQETAAFLKNALGSDRIEFRYRFVTGKKCRDRSLLCKLPVAAHQEKALALISHKSGKKSLTRFAKLGESREVDLWGAIAGHPRMHQIRLHALESGLPVLGDPIYTGRSINPADVSPISKQGRTSLRSGLGLVLHELDLSGVFAGDPVLKGEYPKPFSALLQKCGFDHV